MHLERADPSRDNHGSVFIMHVLLEEEKGFNGEGLVFGLGLGPPISVLAPPGPLPSSLHPPPGETFVTHRRINDAVLGAALRGIRS